ncbi:MAG: hypothetical protein ACTSQO_14565 [Candidatus Helarchaeota archaeon]
MIDMLIQIFPYAFLTLLILVIVFFIFNRSESYINISASRGFILSLFKITHIPVKLLNRITSKNLYEAWEIEKVPPDWLSEDVIKLKSRITWKDRAYFWHLLLRSGSREARKNLGRYFLPQLMAYSLKIIFVKTFKLFIHPIYCFNKFIRHPIKAYLEFTGSFSGSAINWICSSSYKDSFIEATRRAGFPIGYYYGKKYLKDPIFDNKNDALKAMQLIMFFYVLFGLSGWEKHIYPQNQPEVKIHSKDTVSISFPGRPYKCPHRGMKCPEVCQGFVSWEDGLVNAVNKDLTSFVTKSLAAGDNRCAVIITKKEKK